MKLSFVLTEAALELVPKEVRKNASVVNEARRREVDASRMLLDRSLHQSAMDGLRDSEKRGRPDLVHLALLSVTGTPLYLDGGVKVFLQTHDGNLLEFAEKTRIPKSYLRFRGLMEKILVEESGAELVEFEKGNLKDLLNRIEPDLVCGLSVQGKSTRLPDLASRLASIGRPCVLVGGFSNGHFTKETLQFVDELVRIDERPLEAHVVASRLVYEVEKATRPFND